MTNPKTYSLAAILLAGLAAASASAADPIVHQERLGSRLVVTYASGRVATNGLFLAMRPEVRAEADRAAESRRLAAALAAVVAETRAAIPETAPLTDAEIAALYLAQMAKPADTLSRAAETNTLDRLIGAGMRIDLGAIPEPEPERELPPGVGILAALAAGAAAGRATRGRAAA